MAPPGLEMILITDIGIMNLRMEMFLLLRSQLDKQSYIMLVALLLNFFLESLVLMQGRVSPLWNKQVQKVSFKNVE